MTTYYTTENELINLSGIEYEVESKVKVTRDDGIDSVEVEFQEIMDIFVSGESIMWNDYTYQGRPLIEVLEERVR